MEIMFQEFKVTSAPKTGAEHLAELRQVLQVNGLSGFLIPRADAHMGENVAPCSERLSWLTGFTGSAGFCAALLDEAGVFIDGRYTLQVRQQIDLSVYTPVPSGEVKLSDWLNNALPDGGVIAYDPWLHGAEQIEKLQADLRDTITLRKTGNLVDQIWSDRPDAPKGRVVPHDITYAGETSANKRARIGNDIDKRGQVAAVLTLPDSIAWLLNIRGADVSNTPVALCFAILHSTGTVDLFIDMDKCDAVAKAHLEGVAIHPEADFLPALAALKGDVGVDRETAPIVVSDALNNPVWANDPCILPKARKNAAEIAGSREAHIRDGAAMVEFLCWLEREAPSGKLTEISVVQALENFRRATNVLMDISFETISGAGPNGAIVHYRVDENSDRVVKTGEVLLVDSGGQYVDGTTDITRTVAIGVVEDSVKRANTLVLKGMIAISRARWPVGLAGRDLDGFARMALWQVGMDYDHGTGHGVGAYLGVHEGPQRISRAGVVPLEQGMILSNEPGHYKEGVYGIRIENLVVVEAANIPMGGDRPMMGFETLTFVPIDRHLILHNLLDKAEVEWLDAYHAEVMEKLSGRVSDVAQKWMKRACAPIA